MLRYRRPVADRPIRSGPAATDAPSPRLLRFRRSGPKFRDFLYCQPRGQSLLLGGVSAASRPLWRMLALRPVIPIERYMQTARICNKEPSRSATSRPLPYPTAPPRPLTRFRRSRAARREEARLRRPRRRHSQAVQRPALSDRKAATSSSVASLAARNVSGVMASSGVRSTLGPQPRAIIA